MTFWFEAPGYVVQNSSFLTRQPTAAKLYLTTITLSIVLGTVGNILILGAVYVSKFLKTAGNVFLINLAIADLTVACFVNNFSVVGVTVGEGWFVQRPRLCEFVASLCLTACYCSLLSIGAVSFNRYVNICHYEHYRRIFTTRNSIFMALGLWMVALCLELPNFFGWGGHGYHQRSEMCVFNYRQSVSYSLFFSLVGVGLPWVLISSCYILIFRHVYLSKKRIQAVNNEGKAIENKEGRVRGHHESMKLLRTCFLLFMVYTVCWTPFAVLTVADFANSTPQTVDMFLVTFAHANSSINIILYGVSNNHFRAGYARILRLDRFMSRFRATDGNPTAQYSITIKSHVINKNESVSNTGYSKSINNDGLELDLDKDALKKSLAAIT